MKICRKCNENKCLDEFPNRSKGSIDGKQSYCKECFNITNKAYLHTPNGRKSNNKKVKKWNTNNSEKHKLINRTSQRRITRDLTDSYIIKRIKYGTSLNSKTVKEYPQLIQAARENLKIIRLTKTIK